MSQIYCDKCKEQITIEAETQRLRDGVERVYFTCPHCKAQYTAYYTSKSVKKKQKKIRDLQIKYNMHRISNPKQAEKTFVKLQELKAEIGRDMDSLKAKHGN